MKTIKLAIADLLFDMGLFLISLAVRIDPDTFALYEDDCEN